MEAIWAQLKHTPHWCPPIPPNVAATPVQEQPLFGAIQVGAAAPGVASSPAKAEANPPMVLDLPPDPYEIRIHPVLGLVTFQTFKVNYDHQVSIGEQEPYDPESLLLQWNTLTVSAT